MQANKASPELKQELSSWVQNSRSGVPSPSAQRDLLWLQKAHDLSAVSTDSEKKPQEPDPPSTLKAPKARSDDGGGNFLSSLFGSCAGRRK